MENVAYPQSQCAEASAIGIMVAAGEQAATEILVLAGGEHLIAPCGGCRQRLSEFAMADAPVHLCHPDGRHLQTSMGLLLPHAFMPAHLSRQMREALPQNAAASVRARVPDIAPAVAIILGSGLGGLVDDLDAATAFDYAELPDLPGSVGPVPGHAGKLVIGRLSGVQVMCFQGRVHLYEGMPAGAILPLIQLVHDLGCRRLILTNAAGSLKADVPEGGVSLIADHLNFMGTSPSPGGPRFVGLTSVDDGDFRKVLSDSARSSELSCRKELSCPRWSTVRTPENQRRFGMGFDRRHEHRTRAIAARHLGLRVTGLSSVTVLPPA